MFWPRKKKVNPRMNRTLRRDDGWLRAIAVEDVLQVHGELYRHLRREIDFHEGDMERFFEEPIKKVAEFCHGLPASQSGQFREAAGLLGKCLRTSFLAQRMAHGWVVASHLPADARILAERAWRYAAWLGGLIYPLGVLSELGAKAESSGEIWRPEAGPLMTWLVEHEVSAYQPYWEPRCRRHTSSSSVRQWILASLVDAQKHRFIVSQTEEYFEQLLGLLAGVLDDDAPMAKVVHRARREAIRQDTASCIEEMRGLPIEDGYERLKLAVEAVIEDVMEEQAAENPFRRCEDRLFALWPRFAQRIETVAAKRDLLGLPSSHDELLHRLGEAGIIVGSDNTWLVTLSAEGKMKGLGLPAVEISEPSERLYMLPNLLRATIHEPSGASHESPPEQPEQKRSGDGVETASAEHEEGGTMNLPLTPAEEAVPPHPWGRLGGYLAAIPEEMGWWTEKGRALPWPDVAQAAKTELQAFLKALESSGVAVRNHKGPVPLLHEISVEGRQQMAVIIDSESWQEFAPMTKGRDGK